MPSRSLRQPLAGITVLDLTELLPGPYCTMLLAQLGADVIKIERPDGGDPSRWSAYLVREGAAIFELLHRNKKSLTLNLKSPDGRSIFFELAGRADVLVEGFRAGVMRRLGIDYDSLRGINPRLIYCSLSGHGQESPLSARAGHDINFIGLAGILGLTTDEQGHPVIPGVQFADIGGALFGALSIIAALHGRGEHGVGGYLDVSLHDAASALLVVAWSHLAERGRSRIGERLPLTGAYACYNVYRTADDQFLSLGALEPKFWRDFCAAINRFDFVERQFDAGESGQALKQEVADILATRTRAEWLRIFRRVDACCEPVFSLQEAFSGPVPAESQGPTDDRAEPTGSIEASPPQAGPATEDLIEGIADRFLRPFRFAEQAGVPAPRLGQHNEEILQSLGYSLDRMADLRSRGVI